MHVMARQTSELKATAAANRCSASDSVPRLQSLRAMANDLESAFPGLRDDARFAGGARSLPATLDGTLAPPPPPCPQVTAAPAPPAPCARPSTAHSRSRPPPARR